MFRKNRIVTSSLAIAIGLGAAVAVSVADDTKPVRPVGGPAEKTAMPPKVDLEGWPKRSVEVAKKTIEQYGQPHESTPTMLVWHNNGPWKRTVVHREEVPHDFPVPHTDIVEQFIDFKVPPDKFDELAAYDGSVVVQRTTGEISARCDKEAMNFLALNLAIDIVAGKKSVAEARHHYAMTAKQAMEAMKNKRPMPKYTTELVFDVVVGGTAEPDAPFKAKKPAR